MVVGSCCQPSQRHRCEFGGHGGSVPNRNLVVVPNGFEVERFSAEEESVSREIRAAIGCKGKPLVGVFGRITAWKGQKVLIEALSNLPDVTAVIVGEALFTEEDQQYKQELTVLADHLGVADRVHFTGFQRDVLPFLKAVDLVVHCSTSPEPFGRVIVEALLAGKPVIATRHGAPAEIIEDGVTGVLVSPGDPVLLAEAIERLLADRRWAEKLARAGRDSAGKRFSLDRVLAKWTEFINRTVQGLVEPEPQASDPTRKRAKGREVRLTGT
jgi:glycosyltransferase involved in cell wall biosynthesis